MFKTLQQFIIRVFRNIAIFIPAIIVGIIITARNAESTSSYNLGLILGATILCFIPILLILLIFVSRRTKLTRLVITSILLISAGTYISLIPTGSTSTFSEVEASIILNLGTEAIGAAIFLILLQLGRLGTAIGLVIGVIILEMVGSNEGTVNQDIFINLSGEIFGGLLAAWIIYAILRERDKPENVGSVEPS